MPWKSRLAENTALKAYASPVAYLGDTDFAREFENVRSQIDAEAEFVRTVDRPIIVNMAFHMLKYAALCTKHPGFSEEREWRVIYCPSLEKSNHLIKNIKAIRGEPQPIYKIPLRDIPDEGLVGVEIPVLVERVIIGPTQYSIAIRKAFVELLVEARMHDAEGKVFVSDIPLRK